MKECEFLMHCRRWSLQQAIQHTEVARSLHRMEKLLSNMQKKLKLMPWLQKMIKTDPKHPDGGIKCLDDFIWISSDLNRIALCIALKCVIQGRLLRDDQG